MINVKQTNVKKVRNEALLLIAKNQDQKKLSLSMIKYQLVVLLCQKNMY